MATPTNLKTGAVDIGVNAYSKPANDTAVSALGTVFDSLTKIEKDTRTQKFQQGERTYQQAVEADLLSQEKGIGLFAKGARLQQEALTRTLTPEESRIQGEYLKAQTQREDAYVQGKISYRNYLLDAQTRLRTAITLRPDLADEFRKASVRELGVDVGNAAMQLWQEDMEYLKASGKKEQKYDATDVTTFGKNILEQAKNAGSPNYEILATAVMTATGMAVSDPTAAMQLMETSYQKVLESDPMVQVSKQVDDLNKSLNGIDATIQTLSVSVMSNPDYYLTNPTALEYLQTQYTNNRNLLLAERAKATKLLETHEGKRAQESINRIDGMLASSFRDEVFDPAKLVEKSTAATKATTLGIDQAVSTQTIAATKGAPEAAQNYALNVAGAGYAAIDSQDKVIPSRLGARMRDTRALGSAVDALLSNSIGRKNPAGGAITASTFAMDTPDIVNTFYNIASASYYPYDTGQRDINGIPIQGVVAIDGFFSRGNGAIVKLAATTTADSKVAGKGWLDVLVAQATPEQRKDIVAATARMMSGGALSLHNDIYHNLPTPELQKEFEKIYYAVDLAATIEQGIPITTAPKMLERYVVNGKKLEPSAALTDALNGENGYFAKRAPAFADGLDSWNKLAIFVVNTNAPATLKQAN